MKSLLSKFVVLFLIVGLNYSGLLAVSETFAYFNDTETSTGNVFTADSLDFALSVNEYENSIGLGETVSASSVLVNSGGMDFQYVLEAETISGNEDFCNALELEAKLNGVEKYEGDLMSLGTVATTSLGTWKFDIELPVDEDSFTNGEECQFDVIFKGWQTNVESYGDGGFTDEERMSFSLIAAKMIVLNEFLPRPAGIAYGFDFGNDSSDMPQGEWVELYNNSTQNVNLSGWYIRDSTDGEGNKTDITALNTSPATTVISSKSWLVVYMNKPILNNTGDTVRLFDAANNLIDSHSYDDPDFCEIEPTPGDENSTDASGSCASVPPNKSYARIPDGIGDWVDPVPTPGRPNVLSENETVPEEIAVENVASLSFSETLELAASSVSKFIISDSGQVASESQEMTDGEEIITASGSFEIVASSSKGQDEIANPAPVSSVSVEPLIEPLPEPSPELSPEPSVTPESTETPAAPSSDDEASLAPEGQEPAIPVEPVTVETPTEPVPSPADPPLPTSPSENLGGQAVPAPEQAPAPVDSVPADSPSSPPAE